MNQKVGKGSLKWSQHSILGRHFELSDDSDNIQGKLEFIKVLGHRAVGEYGERRFQLEFTGIRRPTIRMTNELEETVATIRLRWKMHLKAEIELANGSHYRMFSFGVIGRNWKLRDEEGRELCAMVEKWGVIRSSGVFTLSDVRGTDPEPGFLALLMWYIILMILYQESAAAAGAAT